MRKFTLFSPSSFESSLYNEVQFYPAFTDDLKQATSSIIIESPFVSFSYRRATGLLPDLIRALDRGVCIKLSTRDPIEHDDSMRKQAEAIVHTLQNLGVEVWFTHKLHRKLAVIDKSILWEGSLNILSQCNSQEIMRRTNSSASCKEMLRFIAKNEVG